MYNLEDNFYLASTSNRLDELYGLIMNATDIHELDEKFQLDDVIPYYTLQELKEASKNLYLEYKNSQVA